MFALAAPIWALNRFGWVIGSLKVPVTDLLLGFTPLIAAVILVLHTQGAGGLIRFLKRVVDFRPLARTQWLWVALLFPPLIYALTFFGVHLAGRAGNPVVNWPQLPVLTATMFVLAIGEEAGWTGYLLDPLQRRFGALGASLVVAVPWWLGHIPSIVAIGGTVSDIAWWLPGAIALRVLMTWLYNSSGRSVAAVVLFHTMLNAARSVAYPTIGTHYDPVYQITGYAVAFAMAVVVVIFWRKNDKTNETQPSAMH